MVLWAQCYADNGSDANMLMPNSSSAKRIISIHPDVNINALNIKLFTISQWQTKSRNHAACSLKTKTKHDLLLNLHLLT